jgi:hypothetical protein
MDLNDKNHQESYKSRQELAHELGISARTMSRHLRSKLFQVPHRCLLSPQEQCEIKRILEIEPKEQHQKKNTKI